MNTLSLCMITKNEESNLKRLLETVPGVFDEIIIVDTGSTDKTKEVAQSFGAKIYQFTWIDDFAAARNFSFSKATKEYIMWLDADDIILPEDREKILALKQDLTIADMYLMAYNYAQDEHGKCTVKNFRHRIIKRGVSTWQYPIHECMTFAPGSREMPTEIWVTHRRGGDDIVKSKGRNIRILKRAITEHPEDIRLKYYYAKELHHEGILKECVEAFDIYFKSPGGWHEDQVNGRWYQAMAYWQMGQEEKTIDTCMEGIKLDPRFAEFYVILGQIHYNHEHWEQAIPWFELAAKCPIPKTLGTTLEENYTWVPQDRLCKCYSSIGKVVEANIANEKALTYRQDTRFLFNREFLRDILFPGRKFERPIRLSLGSGGKPTPSYRNTDLFAGPNIEEVFDQSKIPYPNACVHAIYSEHSLEHTAGHTGAEETIKEYARVLRHNGDLWLKIPDLELCCENFLRSEDRDAKDGERFGPREWFKYTIYGIQDITKDPNPESQYHRTGFTKTSIKRLLEKYGFRVNEVKNYDGWGTPSIEVHATQIKQPIKVCWLMPGAIDENYGSVRIRRLNIHKWLCNHGVDSKLISDYANNKDLWQTIKYADVVVLSSFEQYEKKLIEQLRRSGISVIYDHCEDLENLPYQNECFGASSAIVCCSTVLAEKAIKYGRAVMIPDAYESGLPKTSYVNNGKLKVLSCQMGGNAEEAYAIKPIIEKLGMELKIMSEWKNHDIMWKLDTWLEELVKADIIITIQRYWLQPAKSNNRTTQSMSLGMPVCASPLQSYKEAIVHGENGYICSSPGEWETYLKLLRDDTELRKKIGEAAKESVKERYSIDAVGNKWLELLEELCLENCGNF
jgi:glycosyltransferase involved in cell wall biosynthesis/predicted SAM-dependent methyltransferase